MKLRYRLGLKLGCLELLVLAAQLLVIDPALAQEEGDTPQKIAPQQSSQTGQDDRQKGSELMSQALKAIQEEDTKGALEALDALVQIRPDEAGLLQMRAEVAFRGGKVERSVKDFDRVVELQPRSLASNWQRGIALYYVDRFEDGAAQFEEHHRVNPDDVENTFWYFLCLAKKVGIEGARKKVIPSRGDSRPPLMEIYQLVQGKMTIADVEKAIAQFPEGSSRRQDAEFYGNLYLGLWVDLEGDVAKAKEYLKKSIESGASGYMVDVAKVHLEHLKKQEASKAKSTQTGKGV